VINSVRVGPLLFLGGLCNFQKISCTAKKEEKKIGKRRLWKKKTNRASVVYFQVLFFNMLKRMLARAIAHQKIKKNLKVRRKKDWLYSV